MTTSLFTEDEQQRRLRVGHALREGHKAAGCNQSDVAFLLGVSRPFISNIEAGREALPAHHIPLLSLAYQIPEEKLR